MQTPQRRQHGQVKGVAEAAERGVERSSPCKVVLDFRMRLDRTGEKDKVKEFQEEILATQNTLLAFAVVQKKTPVLKMVHGISKYYNGDVAREYKGKFVGKVGDRTAMSEPHMVILPEQATWKWQDVRVNMGIEAWKAFAEAEETKYEVWKPTEGTAQVKSLPRVLFLPPLVARFMAERDRTAVEVYNRVRELVDSEANEVDEQDTDLMLTWLIAAGQYVQGGESQPLTLDMQPVLSNEAGFFGMGTQPYQ